MKVHFSKYKIISTLFLNHVNDINNGIEAIENHITMSVKNIIPGRGN